MLQVHDDPYQSPKSARIDQGLQSRNNQIDPSLSHYFRENQEAPVAGRGVTVEKWKGRTSGIDVA